VRTGGYAPRDRGGVQFGQQRLIAPKRIGLGGINLRAKAAALQKLLDTAVGSTPASAEAK